jgi:hypothetical protein
MSPEKLGDLIQNYIKEGVALKEQIIDICIHSNGGIELNSAWGMSFEDRELAIKRINKKNKEQSPGGKEYM